MDIDEAKSAIAEANLCEAEVEYLLANGWIRHIGVHRSVSGKLEDRWSFPKPEFVLSRRYQLIRQGHAINAQKAMANLRGYWLTKACDAEHD